MNNALRDIRGLSAFVVTILSIVGFVVLTVAGEGDAARDLAMVFGGPALAF